MVIFSVCVCVRKIKLAENNVASLPVTIILTQPTNTQRPKGCVHIVFCTVYTVHYMYMTCVGGCMTRKIFIVLSMLSYIYIANSFMEGIGASRVAGYICFV